MNYRYGTKIFVTLHIRETNFLHYAGFIWKQSQETEAFVKQGSKIMTYFCTWGFLIPFGNPIIFT